jgi:hypothetical protein
VRVRVVLGVALLLAAGALVLDMSGSSRRTAGSNHINPTVFSATVPPGGVVCQPAFLPGDAASVQILIGTFGHAVPPLQLQFVDSAGQAVASGTAPPGARQGTLTIPLRRVQGAPAAKSACLHFGGTSPVAVGGEAGPIHFGSELVDGRPQPGVISLFYLRRGSESWWQLLPALTRRFGLGKASFLGTWTLPVIAALLFALWVATTRLLVRELT